MFTNLRLWPRNDLTRTEDRPTATISEGSDSSVITTRIQEPSGQGSSSSAVHQRRRESVFIHGPNHVECVAFRVFGDVEHVVSGDSGGRVRFWRVDNGSEVGVPIDTGSVVYSIAASQDGRWIVSGMGRGMVQLWNAQTRHKVRDIQAHWHSNVGITVDISQDATRIATGSDDRTACVWSLSTGDLLLGPWQHHSWVTTAKFSPSGRLVATASWGRDSVRVYNEDDRCLFDVAIQVGSLAGLNNSLAWSPDGKRLLTLSHDGKIRSLDTLTGKTLLERPVHSAENVGCIAVASNGAFIAASAGSSVSLWDTATQQQIGSVIQLDDVVLSLSISDHHDLAIGGNGISILNLGDILSPSHWGVGEPRLEKVIEELCDAQHTAKEQSKLLHDQIEQLSETNEKLRRNLVQSQHAVDEQKAQTDSVHSLQMKANDEIAQLRHANQELRCVVRVHEQKHQCEDLYTQGRIFDAAKLLLEINNTAGEHITSDRFLSDWLTEFTSRCMKTLEKNGDSASEAGKPESVTAYAAALSLGSSTPDVLSKWASAALTNSGAREALRAGVEFKVSRLAVYRAICKSLEDVGRLEEAVETFLQMQNDLREAGTGDEQMLWERNFRERCAAKLVNIGETVRDSGQHDEAIRYYSDAISLKPTNINDILLRRGNELIELDPSSHKGYEDRYTALNGMRHYSEAFQVFKEMLSILEQSRDPKVRDLRHRYFDATSAIRNEVEEAIRFLPTVLIDTDTGQLYNKTRQAGAFEDLPIYDELRSSMATALDHSRIRKEVTDFYRYVMFSHKWQPDEPTFQQVEHDSVYRLPSSPTFDKLRNFCKLVVALRYKWAWTDTCCVNQLDKGVLQESIIAMFRWYRHSSLTVVHLLGVLSESQVAGCLLRSIWNTRGWTYQEYVASEVVQFYTEDWKPYLGLDMFNHKKSPAVLSEMEQATNLTTQQFVTLQPGLDRAREKLFLASGRQTMREEDMAYSLFGIFGVALPVMYGERDLAVGRLLEHILTRSDEVTLLAWTGHSGSHHSYLPASLTVYNQILPPHVPAPIETSEMDCMVSILRSSVPDPSPVIELYERLYSLPPLSLVSGRLRLSGIVFPLGALSPHSKSDASSDVRVYHTMTPLLGDIEIKTTTDLSGMRGLRLIHPWITPLVDHDFSFDEPLFDLETRALRLLVRLGRPFGGLLLAPAAREQYRRVATDSLIVVRVLKKVDLRELVDAVRTVNVQ